MRTMGGVMKTGILAIAATLLLAIPALAQPKPCEELKSEIEEKIKKNGVQSFTLDVLPKGDGAKAEGSKETAAKSDGAGEGKVVGTCDGGTKQIIYKR